METTATSDRASHGPSDPVKVTLHLRNRSGRVCRYDASHTMRAFETAGAQLRQVLITLT